MFGFWTVCYFSRTFGEMPPPPPCFTSLEREIQKSSALSISLMFFRIIYVFVFRSRRFHFAIHLQRFITHKYTTNSYFLWFAQVFLRPFLHNSKLDVFLPYYFIAIREKAGANVFATVRIECATSCCRTARLCFSLNFTISYKFNIKTKLLPLLNYT